MLNIPVPVLLPVPSQLDVKKKRKKVWLFSNSKILLKKTTFAHMTPLSLYAFDYQVNGLNVSMLV